MLCSTRLVQSSHGNHQHFELLTLARTTTEQYRKKHRDRPTMKWTLRWWSLLHSTDHSDRHVTQTGGAVVFVSRAAGARVFRLWRVSCPSPSPSPLSVSHHPPHSQVSSPLGKNPLWGVTGWVTGPFNVHAWPLGHVTDSAPQEALVTGGVGGINAHMLSET